RPPAPATVICEEFLKVLGRSEVEQPMICQRICAMLRHVAAIEMASSMKFCSSKRGVENHLIKSYFKKLTLIQELSWSGSSTKVPEKTVRELDKLPPTAGYGGDQDLIDIPVYFHDPEYSEEDKDALKRLSEIFRMAHLPPIQVVDAAEQDGELTVDEHTLEHAPPANCSSKVDADRVGSILRGYEEFKLDRRRAPHTVGPSHMYIRKDIVEQTEKEGIVPPYPVNFPHDYPYPHRSWYLDKLKKKG
ncbi:uncharacterized protein THITE_2030952, partial [Thermothielavioides terrestris NRRL 8126]